MVQNLVRSTLSLTFVISAARVVFNVKARMTREATWQLELKGDLTKQRRVEAVDKLMSVLTLLVAAVFGLQAIGLDGERLLALQHHAHVAYHPHCVLICAQSGGPNSASKLPFTLYNPDVWPDFQCSDHGGA